MTYRSAEKIVRVSSVHVDEQPERSRFSRQQCNLTVSIGLAFSENKNNDSYTLMQRADEALYESKSAGRNCWRIAD